MEINHAMPMKKPFELTIWVEAGSEKLYTLMTMQGRDFEVKNMQAVQHGGIDDQTGQVRSKPTAREFIMTYATSIANGEEFAVYDLGLEAGKQGMSSASVKQGVVTVTNDGLLTRTRKGFYKLVATPPAPKDLEKLPKVRAQKKQLPLRPDSISSRIVTFLKEHQGGGAVKLSDIKAGLKMNGSKNISPMMFDLMQSKRIERTGKSLYRATEG